MIRLFTLSALLLLPGLPVAAQAPRFDGTTPLEWSQRLAASERVRYGETLRFQGTPHARWNYSSGLLAQFLLDLAEATDDEALRDYAADIVASFVAPDGSIRTYEMSTYNLDMVTPGKVLLRLYEHTGQTRFKIAVGILREQLRRQPRTTEGGFWHKQLYPNQMWLDGLYMASPFYAAYASLGNEPAALDDVAKQLLAMDRHAYVAEVGLHRHGWDEARVQSWADPGTGQSPNFWGRGEGWYVMALVDSLDFFPANHPARDALIAVLQRTADGIGRHQDTATGVWWQVLDQPQREGNYLEASASAQFVYALAKGINQGYLSRDHFEPIVRRGYAGLIREFIRIDAAGLVDLTRCCQVAGLGYTNRAGRARDGSFDYYVSEPVIANDPKGTGPFIGAGVQVQALLGASTAVDAVPGWEDVRLRKEVSGINAPRSIAYDPLMGRWYVGCFAAGAGKTNRGVITRLHDEGDVEVPAYIAGGQSEVTLHEPRGMAFWGHELWVADIDVVRVFDARNGQPMREYDLSTLGEVSLTDITMNASGLAVLVTDRGGSQAERGRIIKLDRQTGIHVVAEGKWLASIKSIAVDAKRAGYVLASGEGGPLFTWSEGDAAGEPRAMPTERMGAAAVLSNGVILVTSVDGGWWGEVDGGRVRPVVSGIGHPGDIAIDEHGERIAVLRPDSDGVSIWSVPGMQKGLIVENDFVVAHRHISVAGKAGPGSGKRVIVALGGFVLKSAGKTRPMKRGEVVVFAPAESYAIPPGSRFVEVQIKPDHPAPQAPREFLPPQYNVQVYDCEDFYIYEERLEPGQVRPLHSHSQRVGIALAPAELFRIKGILSSPQIPDKVGFSNASVHMILNMGSTPLCNIMIEFKPPAAK